MRNVMRDIVAVKHRDGTNHDNIRALVDSNKIFINDVTIPISIGDWITRKLPSGQEETYIVTDYHLYSGGHTIPDFYEISYEREELRTHRVQPRSVNVNVESSPQARVTLNSTDQSVNVIGNQNEEVFEQLRSLLADSITDADTRDLLLEKVDEMERSRGSDSFMTAYREFISAAADHMTILAPLVPMLSAML